MSERSADPGGPSPREPTPSPASASELLKRLAQHRRSAQRHSQGARIGGGGMGDVFQVRDEDLGRELAMKVLRRDFAEGSERDRERMLARFLEEAQVTGQLHHPSIVPVHELALDEQGRPYFTMPLIRGRDFGEIIQLSRLGHEGWSLARALGVVLKVCEAVAYAHSRGVIHRDLKPGNVRVGRFGETYLMDWGLARVLGRNDGRDLRLRDPAILRSSAVRTERSRSRGEEPDSPLVTMDGDVVGTPYYMSPEQARGEIEHVGVRSDVYSLGALLYHLLCGRAPYQPASGQLSARAVWSLVLEGPPRPLREIAPDAPEELADICRKAMEREPERRYADAQEIAQEIEAFLDRRPVRAHAPTVGYALKLAYERNRRALRIAALIALPLLLVAGYFGWNVRTARAAEQWARLAADDQMRAVALQHELDELFPATPRQLPKFERWLATADDLLGRRAEYEAAFREQPSSAADRETLEQLCKEVADLERDRQQVRTRREFAEQLERVSLREPAAEWAKVREDVRSSPRYAGLELPPQMGLVPLWKNDFGLWEFWHVASGRRPDAASADAYEPQFEDGIVLVLLPGGTFEMGSSDEDIKGGIADPNELRHEVTLGAFFLARTEITQAQWIRAMGSNPSRICPEDESHGVVTLRHPVDSVTWPAASEFSRRMDLRLPQEAEWEYAARAGGTGRYGSDDSWDSLEGHENLLDESLPLELPGRAPWNDTHPYHAPVASYAPDAFGLFDMLGNVSEWCADEVHMDMRGMPVTGSNPCVATRIVRGGSWYLGPTSMKNPIRCAYRQWDGPTSTNHARGARMARSIE